MAFVCGDLSVRETRIRPRNPDGGVLHELGEGIHAKNTTAFREVNFSYQAVTLEFRLLSIRFGSGAFVSNRKKSAIAYLQLLTASFESQVAVRSSLYPSQ